MIVQNSPFILHFRPDAVSNLDEAEWYVDGPPQLLAARSCGAISNLDEAE